ncbi:hypothetical protein D3C74_428210 [compost metagenome]
MLAVERGLRAEQLAGKLQRTLVIHGLQDARGIMARIVQARKFGGLGRIVPAHEVILRAFVVAGLVREQVEQGSPDIPHFVLRAHILQG